MLAIIRIRGFDAGDAFCCPHIGISAGMTSQALASSRTTLLLGMVIMAQFVALSIIVGATGMIRAPIIFVIESSRATSCLLPKFCYLLLVNLRSMAMQSSNGWKSITAKSAFILSYVSTRHSREV
jgi:hypothetical protein